MQNRYFQTIRKGHVGDGTTAALVAWLERYANVLFPNNGIEYWHLAREGEGDKPPMIEGPLHHVACYVCEGQSEGLNIRVAVQMRQGRRIELARVKTFGSWEESWQIAAALSNALECILIWEEVPGIVDMADLLPREHRFSRETNLVEPVEIRSSGPILTVSTQSGHRLAEYDFTKDVARLKEWPDLQYSVLRRYTADWKTVLKNMGASFLVVEDGAKVAA